MTVAWEHLARANTHPLRVSILEVICLDGGRTLSPKDLSLELGAALGNVNYHVTELVKAGLLELESQRQVRGAVEHFYRQTQRSNGAGSSNGAGKTAASRAKQAQ
ncbi:MAG TPA: helix-turn-helix domain-containing protein [Solirubrobacterales bacterium]|jgi:predicted ArsR family transcriptional regulator